jgi:hypothetical protein
MRSSLVCGSSIQRNVLARVVSCFPTHSLECSRILSCSFEWVLLWRKVSRSSRYIAAGCLIRARRARERFDFLHTISGVQR